VLIYNLRIEKPHFMGTAKACVKNVSFMNSFLIGFAFFFYSAERKT
jgi:hypothetical protein